MNAVTKYKLKYMAKGALKITGIMIIILCVACIDIYLAYITTVSITDEHIVYCTIGIAFFYCVLTAIVLTSIIEAIAKTWKNIKVPIIITDEKAQKKAGGLSIVKQPLAK